MKGGKSRAAAPKRSDTKLKTKSVGASKPAKKAGKDPNKPKRPASAFFVFMEEFREKYKKEHPNNKSVAAVGKAGGEKWKSLSDAEKAPYQAKAEKRKVEYNKNMDVYNKKQVSDSVLIVNLCISCNFRGLFLRVAFWLCTIG
ncbi:hypothetical protein ABKV19_001483 [Rosa sericea]